MTTNKLVTIDADIPTHITNTGTIQQTIIDNRKHTIFIGDKAFNAKQLAALFELLLEKYPEAKL